MGRKKAVLTGIFVCFAFVLFAQQKDSVKVHLNHYTLTIGAGWSHYIDNLDYGVQDIKKNAVGVSFKFFWEPEYRLSLGLESGYYRLFKITDQVNPDTSVQIVRTVVPLLLLVRMRIVDNFYLGAGMGIALITNKATGAGQEIVTKTTSLANFELSAAYIYPLTKHWLVGGEVKAFHFANLEDWMYSIQATCAVKL
jgi:hypothetical protein